MKQKARILSILFIFVLGLVHAQQKSDAYELILRKGTKEQLISAMKADSLFYKTLIGKDTILMCALKYDRDESFIQTIIKSGVKMQAKNNQNQTALMYACRYSSDEGVIKLIFSKQGNEKALKTKLLQKDKSGKTSIDHATLNNSPLAVELLTALFPERKIVHRTKNPTITLTGEEEPEIQAEAETELQEEEQTQPEPEVETTPEVQPEPEPTPEPEPEPELPPEPTPKPEEKTSEPEAEAEVPPMPEKPVEASPEDFVPRYTKQYLYDYALIEEDPEPEAEPEEPELPKIANPDKKDKDGRTALMKAVKDGNDWEIRSLLNSGANVNLADNDGWTALMYALRWQNNAEVVSTLLQHGANAEQKTKYGATALQLAAMYTNNPAILKKIMDASNANAEDLFRAFIMTITSGNTNAVTQKTKLAVFIDRGVPINRYFEGRTPLMYACEFASSTEVIALLLQNGASPSARSRDGKTAFDYAKNNGRLTHDDTYWALNSR